MRLAATMFTRFTGGKEGTLWYYQALAEVFARVSPGILSAELGEAVREMARRGVRSTLTPRQKLHLLQHDRRANRNILWEFDRVRQFL
jgi:hypothetical protein